jgi:glycosyltransferase involved in cell wall biosynthesis
MGIDDAQSRLRVFVIGPRGIPNAEGGIENYATQVLPRLVKEGFDVSVACIKAHAPLEHYRGVRIIRLASRSFLSTDKHIYLLLAIAHAIWTRPDIIVLVGTAAGLLTLPSRLIARRVYVRCGSVDQIGAKWGQLGRAFIRLSELQYRHATGIIAVSENLAATLKGMTHATPIAHIPNGLDQAAERATSRPREFNLSTPYILAVGRITQQKDYVTLAKAFKAAKLGSTRLVICGSHDGSLSPQELSHLQDERIVLKGFVGKPDLPAYYRHASLFVNSSFSEGMSNSLLEANSYRLPVIVSDIPANRELGIPEHCYFTTGDHAALARLLERALRAPANFVPSRVTVPDWNEVARRTALFLRGNGPESKAIPAG